MNEMHRDEIKDRRQHTLQGKLPRWLFRRKYKTAAAIHKTTVKRRRQSEIAVKCEMMKCRNGKTCDVRYEEEIEKRKWTRNNHLNKHDMQTQSLSVLKKEMVEKS